MSRCSPFVIMLSDADRAVLEERARAYTAAHAEVVRANRADVCGRRAEHGDCRPAGCACWRSEPVALAVRPGGAGRAGGSQADGPSAGARAEVVAEVKALACGPPATSGVPLARWSCPELAREAAVRGITPTVSASTVRRWLAADVLRPWRHRSWIFPRDPYFGFKAARVLGLYERI